MKLKLNHKINRRLCLLVFCLTLLSSLAHQLHAQSKKRVFTVVLDAGHGGHDPGKVAYRKYKEKEIALDIVLEAGKILEAHKDIKVIYTRKKDVFVDLWVRGKIANKADADLFVSVHCNAHNSQASGSETWVLGLHANKRNFEVAKAENEVILLEENYEEKYKGFNPNSPQSVIGLTLEQEENLDKSLLLASSIQTNLKKELKRLDRGVKQAGFVVLHQTYMPSILIETGFLTNKKEGAYLYSKKGKKEMAVAISKAIIKYVEGIRLNTIEVIETPKIVKTNTKPNTDDVYFKIQIASGRSKIKTYSYNFKGLKNVERVKVGSYYKYYFGKTSGYKQAKKNLDFVKRKGYTSAFVAAFKNGVKIPLSEALK